MGCTRLMDREDTKPVTKYKSPRGTKANDKQKETWPYFLQWKGLQTGTTTLVFLQHDVDAFLFGIQSSQQMQTWLPHPVSFFSLPILYHFNPCVICDLHWPGYRLSYRLTPRLPSTAGLTHISMQNSNLLLPEMGSRAPSLQPFHRGKCYGLKAQAQPGSLSVLTQASCITHRLFKAKFCFNKTYVTALQDRGLAQLQQRYARLLRH